jgi:hypothetical protein
MPPLCPLGDQAERRALDARLTEALEQAKRGETYGPFETHEAMTDFLHRQVKEARTGKIRSAKPRAR